MGVLAGGFSSRSFLPRRGRGTAEGGGGVVSKRGDHDVSDNRFQIGKDIARGNTKRAHALGQHPSVADCIPFGVIATRLGGAGDVRSLGSGNCVPWATPCRQMAPATPASTDGGAQ